LWVHASSQARFEEAYRGIAERLELPGRHDAKADVLRLVSDWLCDEENGPWTMVLDNVDDMDTFSHGLAAYLPQSRNGSILVTSRSKDAATRLVGGYSNVKEVFAMDSVQGLELLCNKLQGPERRQGAADLLHALHYLPLAITQAAAYINRRAHMTAQGYLREFNDSGEKKESLLNWETCDLRRDESASNSVVTTWQMSFECIKKERPSAADLLSLMSLFNPQEIPESALRRRAQIAASAGHGDDVGREFEADLDLLQAYSLVTAMPDADVCEMHPLVQFCTQAWLASSGVVEQWQFEFLELMAREFPFARYEDWALCQQLYPHIVSLFDCEPTTDCALKAWAQVLAHAAWYLWMRGRYSIGQEIATKALKVRETVLGRDDEDTLSTLNTLALLLQAQGKYDDAEKLNRQALAARSTVSSQDDELQLTTASNLASVLLDRGNLDEAVELNRWVLFTRRGLLGPDHPSVLVSLNSLALVLQVQGKYSEAETFHRDALHGRTALSGAQHPDTLLSINNLAGSLQAQEKYNEAESLYRQAFAGRQRTLGPRHPSTLTSQSNLASVLLATGQCSGAETLYRQVLQERTALDARHPNTLTALANLATALHAQSHFDEAETLSRRALDGRHALLGARHPDTLTSVNNLADLLARVQRYDEAETLYRRACEGLEATLGPLHPWSVACGESYAAMQDERAKKTARVHCGGLWWWKKDAK
jgi:tetratricopeptide (TPR) repeat protein